MGRIGMKPPPIRSASIVVLALGLVGADAPPGAILDKQRLLDAQTFWGNRDWDWYQANIPFFECLDTSIKTTYYYLYEMTTKDLTYGSPASGHSFTEFIDRPLSTLADPAVNPAWPPRGESGCGRFPGCGRRSPNRGRPTCQPASRRSMRVTRANRPTG